MASFHSALPDICSTRIWAFENLIPALSKTKEPLLIKFNALREESFLISLRFPDALKSERIKQESISSCEFLQRFKVQLCINGRSKGHCVQITHVKPGAYLAFTQLRIQSVYH